jgi:hypothetical protein
MREYVYLWYRLLEINVGTRDTAADDLLNSCFGIYKSILVAALKKFLAAETNSRSGPRILKTGSKQSENLVF